MNAYYNDSDPFCAQWLRNLIAAGAIPAGTVDERSIADIEPSDLRGFDHVHFFAGIGGWAYALRLAGWDMDRPVWTGSCPCQPFSSAGRQGGALDERHLWPRWLRLIRKCRPHAILGEQVEGAVGFGWIDRVSADLEAEGYTCGAAVLGAHSLGAPHIRQRLFWVAHAADGRHQPVAGIGGLRAAEAGDVALSEPCIERAVGGMADAGSEKWRRLSYAGTSEQRVQQSGCDGAAGGLADAHRERCAGLSADADAPFGHDADRRGEAGSGELADSSEWGRRGNGGWQEAYGELGTRSEVRGFWSDAVWLPCLDGKARRVEPAIQPLASGIPNRVGLLRGSGNAITPQTTALVIEAVMECLP